MPAALIPLAAAGVTLVVDAAAAQACSSCQRAVALLVVRRVGTAYAVRCLACDAA